MGLHYIMRNAYTQVCHNHMNLVRIHHHHSRIHMMMLYHVHGARSTYPRREFDHYQIDIRDRNRRT